jgi:hypothetical protein
MTTEKTFNKPSPLSEEERKEMIENIKRIAEAMMKDKTIRRLLRVLANQFSERK